MIIVAESGNSLRTGVLLLPLDVRIIIISSTTMVDEELHYIIVSRDNF